MTSGLDRASSPSASAVPDDSPHSKILRLLRVLHKINSEVEEQLAFETAVETLPESAFVNNKLTAKLTRQLEEPMIVARFVEPTCASFPTLIFSHHLDLVHACRIGQSISPNTTPSYSPSPRVSRSYKTPLSATLALSSNGRANKVDQAMIREETTASDISAASNVRKSGYRASTFWSLPLRYSSYMALPPRC